MSRYFEIYAIMLRNSLIREMNFKVNFILWMFVELLWFLGQIVFVEVLFQYVDNGAPMALSGAGSYIVGCASVAPAVLFEEMDLEPASDETARPPLVPPPTAAK